MEKIERGCKSQVKVKRHGDFRATSGGASSRRDDIDGVIVQIAQRDQQAKKRQRKPRQRSVIVS
jgi:hypothetical protein